MSDSRHGCRITTAPRPPQSLGHQNPCRRTVAMNSLCAACRSVASSSSVTARLARSEALQVGHRLVTANAQ